MMKIAKNLDTPIQSQNIKAASWTKPIVQKIKAGDAELGTRAGNDTPTAQASFS
jgi:hypothetical protein